MKKIALIFALIGGFAIMNAQAQCKKSKTVCCKIKTAKCDIQSTLCCSEGSTTEAKIACAQKCAAAGLPCVYWAAYFASLDESIEEMKSTASGDISFYKRKTCHFTGNESLTQVEFDHSKVKFINASPDMEVNMENCKLVCTPEQLAQCKAMNIKCAKSRKTSLASNDRLVIRP